MELGIVFSLIGQKNPLRQDDHSIQGKGSQKKLPGHPPSRKGDAPEREGSWGHRGVARKVE